MSGMVEELNVYIPGENVIVPGIIQMSAFCFKGILCEVPFFMVVRLFSYFTV